MLTRSKFFFNNHFEVSLTNQSSSKRGKNLNKVKSEKFSCKNTSIHVENTFHLSLGRGFKVLMRTHNVGFDNCIMWLKERDLELWKPSNGEYHIVDLTSIIAINADSDCGILTVKCSNQVMYEFKSSDGTSLEPFRLFLKFSSAKLDLSEPNIDQNQPQEDFFTHESSKKTCDQMMLFFRPPTLSSPLFSHEREKARLRLRSRSSNTNVPKRPPKRTRKKEEKEKILIEESRSKRSKFSTADSDIIRNETVSL